MKGSSSGGEALHHTESDAGRVRGNAAQSDRVGNGGAFAVGEPVAEQLGRETIVVHARNVRLIGESRRKDDRLDARTLARLARIDPHLLSPVQHRSRPSAGASDGDPSASWAGAGANRADQYGAGADQVLRGATARPTRGT